MVLTAAQRGTIVREAEEMRAELVAMFDRQRMVFAKLGTLLPAGPMDAPDSSMVRLPGLPRWTAHMWTQCTRHWLQGPLPKTSCATRVCSAYPTESQQTTVLWSITQRESALLHQMLRC